VVVDKPIEWNPEKSRNLKAKRNISFEEIVDLLHKDEYLEDLPHYNVSKYPKQRILYFRLRGYIYMVPYVEDPDKIFLKTIIPSRKAQKRYKKATKESNEKK
jgi:uncharacterized DUF497 family protein